MADLKKIDPKMDSWATRQLMKLLGGNPKESPIPKVTPPTVTAPPPKKERPVTPATPTPTPSDKEKKEKSKREQEAYDADQKRRQKAVADAAKKDADTYAMFARMREEMATRGGSPPPRPPRSGGGWGRDGDGNEGCGDPHYRIGSPMNPIRGGVTQPKATPPPVHKQVEQEIGGGVSARVVIGVMMVLLCIAVAIGLVVYNNSKHMTGASNQMQTPVVTAAVAQAPTSEVAPEASPQVATGPPVKPFTTCRYYTRAFPNWERHLLNTGACLTLDNSNGHAYDPIVDAEGRAHPSFQFFAFAVGDIARGTDGNLIAVNPLRIRIEGKNFTVWDATKFDGDKCVALVSDDCFEWTKSHPGAYFNVEVFSGNIVTVYIEHPRKEIS
ncbi:MAG: hypothetical protein WC444_00315 [Candidatus Paceibacterota bacterium]